MRNWIFLLIHVINICLVITCCMALSSHHEITEQEYARVSEIVNGLNPINSKRDMVIWNMIIEGLVDNRITQQELGAIEKQIAK